MKTTLLLLLILQTTLWADLDMVLEYANSQEYGIAQMPLRLSAAGESRQVEKRYSKKMVKVQIMKSEKYKVKEMQGDEYSGKKLVEVTKTRRVPTGKFREEERIVPDPEGNIVRKVTVTDRVKDGGGDFMRPGLLAINAMALHVYLEHGLTYSDSPEVRRSLQLLHSWLDLHGLPDATRDLAWLTVVYSALAKESTAFAVMQQRLVNKLLEGAAVERGVEGLWGPISIHHELFVKIYNEIGELDEEIAKLKALAEKNPKSTKVAKAKIEATNRRNAIESMLGDISRHAIRYQNSTKSLKLKEIVPSSMFGEEVDACLREEYTLKGLPWKVYGSGAVDLENTSLALFALAQAKRFDLLPDETPEPSKNKKVRYRLTVKTKTLLGKTLRSLIKHQERDGSFGQMNLHYVRKAYAKSQLQPMDKVKAQKLESPITPLSSAQAWRAFHSLETLLGASPLRASKSKISKLEEHLVETLGSLGESPIQILYSESGSLGEFLFLIQPLLAEKELTTGLLEKLEDNKDKTGWWSENRSTLFSTSVYAMNPPPEADEGKKKKAKKVEEEEPKKKKKKKPTGIERQIADNTLLNKVSSSSDRINSKLRPTLFTLAFLKTLEE